MTEDLQALLHAVNRQLSVGVATPEAGAELQAAHEDLRRLADEAFPHREQGPLPPTSPQAEI